MNMRFFYVFFLIPAILSAASLISGCSSGKAQKSSAPSGKFMQNEQPSQHSSSPSSKSYFSRERERRREHEREFRDVRRPMDQDHFKVMPWHGKHYESRSEQLHESSREPDSSLFRF